MKYIYILLLTFANLIDPVNINSQIPEKGMIAYYPFNANAHDRSSNCIHGTVHNTQLTYDRFNYEKASYHFNGTSSHYIEILNPAFELSEFSYSLWAMAEKIPGPGDSYGILSIGGNNYRDQVLCIRNEGWGATSYNIDESNQTLYSPNETILNSWTHLVLTRSKNRVKFYENGKLVDDQIIPNSLPPLYSPNLKAAIGIRHDKTHPFKGNIDDIRIYNRVITDKEVDTLYNEHLCYLNIIATDTLLIDVDPQGPDEFNINIKIYPNPTLSNLIIDIANHTALKNYSLNLINSAGSQFFGTKIEKQIYDLDLAKWLAAGIYFLYLYDPDGNIVDVKKIILQ